MSNRLTVALRWLIAGTLAGGTLGSVGIAVAQTDESTTTTAPSSSAPSASAPAVPAAPGEPEPRRNRTPLTGDALEKAKAAALAAVPGATIKKAMTGAGGAAYEVRVQRPDGTPATVKLDENFDVTGIEEGRAGGRCHHGRGRPGGPGGEVTGETAEKVKAAALAAVPGATVDRTLQGRDGGYVALVTKSDGTRAAVKLDGSFNVTSVEDKAGRRGGRGHRHGPPPAEDRGSGNADATGTTTNA